VQLSHFTYKHHATTGDTYRWHSADRVLNFRIIDVYTIIRAEPREKFDDRNIFSAISPSRRHRIWRLRLLLEWSGNRLRAETFEPPAGHRRLFSPIVKFVVSRCASSTARFAITYRWRLSHVLVAVMGALLCGLRSLLVGSRRAASWVGCNFLGAAPQIRNSPGSIRDASRVFSPICRAALWCTSFACSLIFVITSHRLVGTIRFTGPSPFF